ncbi:Uu.00g089930.m01.CDS01 [Anthostomella pinea]|uniref:Uu.00g089930.m01.CDS01 n=1 Tax=Anthostomella pinea TaxID=933095 RepID=A0AAI8VNE9_9PEZI|nr:Uu.00g089930.m01.CDS01 [Anthostomella pinea]
MDPIGLLTTVCKITSAMPGIIRKYKDSKTELSAIHNELIELRLILEVLENDTPNQNVVPKSHQKAIKSMIDGCYSVVTELDQLLGKLGQRTGPVGAVVVWAEDMENQVGAMRSQLGIRRELLALTLSVTTASLAKSIKQDTKSIKQVTKSINQDTTSIKDDTSTTRRDLAALRSDINQLVEHVNHAYNHPSNGIGSENNRGSLLRHCAETVTTLVQEVCHDLESSIAINETAPISLSNDAYSAKFHAVESQANSKQQTLSSICSTPAPRLSQTSAVTTAYSTKASSSSGSSWARPCSTFSSTQSTLFNGQRKGTQHAPLPSRKEVSQQHHEDLIDLSEHVNLTTLSPADSIPSGPFPQAVSSRDTPRHTSYQGTIKPIQSSSSKPITLPPPELMHTSRLECLYLATTKPSFKICSLDVSTYGSLLATLGQKEFAMYHFGRKGTPKEKMKLKNLKNPYQDPEDPTDNLDDMVEEDEELSGATDDTEGSETLSTSTEDDDRDNTYYFPLGGPRSFTVDGSDSPYCSWRVIEFRVSFEVETIVLVRRPRNGSLLDIFSVSQDCHFIAYCDIARISITDLRTRQMALEIPWSDIGPDSQLPLLAFSHGGNSSMLAVTKRKRDSVQVWEISEEKEDKSDSDGA